MAKPNDGCVFPVLTDQHLAPGVGAAEFDRIMREVREAMKSAPFFHLDAENGRVTPIGGPLQVRVKVLPHGEGLELPAYSTEGAVGMDLRAAIPDGEIHYIPPGMARPIPTGLAFAIPPHHAGLVLSRSGLAAKHQVAITNAPGLVDPDYRGEVFLLLENRGPEEFVYRRGDRLGQLLIVPAPPVRLEEVDDLGDTARGEAGLGSTGVGSC